MVKIFSVGSESNYGDLDTVDACQFPFVSKCVCGNKNVSEDAWYPKYEAAVPEVRRMLAELSRVCEDTVTFETFAELRRKVIALVGEERWFPPGTNIGAGEVRIGKPGKKAVEIEDTQRYERSTKCEIIDAGLHLLFNGRAVEAFWAAGVTLPVYPVKLTFASRPVENWFCFELEPVLGLSAECMKKWEHVKCEHCGWLIGYSKAKTPEPLEFVRSVVEQTGGVFRMRECGYTACTEEVRNALAAAKLRGISFSELGTAV